MDGADEPALGTADARTGGQSTAAAVATVTAPADVEAEPELVLVPPLAQLGLFLTVAFTVVLGIWPSPLFDFVHAAHLLF
jgi:hypothetical protein